MEKQFMETLLAQIRDKRARECVGKEIAGHLADQKGCYIADGMTKEQAEAKAVTDMGDPVQTGIALNQIHRPKPAWGMLAMIAVLCAAGVLLQFAISQRDPVSQLGRYFYQNQLQYAVLGYFLLCMIYLADYTKIAKYSRYLCTGILVLLCLAAASDSSVFPKPYAYTSLNIGFFQNWLFPDFLNFLLDILRLDFHRLLSLDIFFYLYLPLYGAVLYSYRSCKTKHLWSIFLYTVLPVYLSIQLAHTSVRINVAVILFLMLGTAVYKGWFPLPAAKIKYAVFTCTTIACLLYNAFLNDYQKIRIQAWLNSAAFADSEGYLQSIIHNILNTSKLIGKNTAEPMDIYLPARATDYILSYTIATFGILTAAVLVLFVCIFSARLLWLSIRQKNHLGMIMGLGCSLAFVIQSAEYILVNLSLLPASSLSLPLISFGGSNMLQTCILLGILLSIYRYENVVSEPMPYTFNTVLHK